ncbi:MAG: alpha/beta fold hydrolase [Proteobacteria bacterium]|nr:alpha/beta fold hydrolase [Pseudomonadota bacterium]
MQRRLAAILAADVVGYSRLMERDEAGTLAALKAHRRALIDPRIAAHGGRMVKLMGDGALVEFASVVEAVQCAAESQRDMAARNAAVAEERRILCRIGVHLGDIIVEGDDIYGEGVNIAARLQGLAAPGRICISRQAFDQVESKSGVGFDDLGEQQVKNIVKPIRVYQIRLDGGVAPPPAAAPAAIRQDIRYCAAADRVQIAYAAIGDGPPLVKTANWLNHLEYDWESPVWRHLLQALAAAHRLIRYDARGNGLSDWDVDDISFDTFVRDLECVVDAAGVARFDLLGISQGCAVAVAYAVRHPERVRRLVLYGGFARGRRRRGSRKETEQAEALLTLMRLGWGQENPAFRQVFTSLFMPEATAKQMQWFNDLQRITCSPENAVRIRTVADDIDVSDLLPRVTTPTLVLHCRGDAVQPFEEGRRMAAMIQGARFVALEGRNHLILEDEPAWGRFLDEVRGFLAGG